MRQNKYINIMNNFAKSIHEYINNNESLNEAISIFCDKNEDIIFELKNEEEYIEEMLNNAGAIK